MKVIEVTEDCTDFKNKVVIIEQRLHLKTAYLDLYLGDSETIPYLIHLGHKY